MKKTFLTSCLLLSMTFAASAQDTPLWLRRNAISPDASQIAFTYKGDIYVVNSEGGRARQLTTNQAYDSNPIWTHDGKASGSVHTVSLVKTYTKYQQKVASLRGSHHIQAAKHRWP